MDENFKMKRLLNGKKFARGEKYYNVVKCNYLDYLKKTVIMDYVIKHKKLSRKFAAKIDGKTAYVSYFMKDDYMNIDHTYVPLHLEGQGIAKNLVVTAFEYAREHNLKVTTTCYYVHKFIQRHPEYSDIL